jgi:hypothetical protein
MLTRGLQDATRKFAALRSRMDCRVKPGNDISEKERKERKKKGKRNADRRLQ